MKLPDNYRDWPIEAQDRRRQLWSKKVTFLAKADRANYDMLEAAVDKQVRAEFEAQQVDR